MKSFYQTAILQSSARLSNRLKCCVTKEKSLSKGPSANEVTMSGGWGFQENVKVLTNLWAFLTLIVEGEGWKS